MRPELLDTNGAKIAPAPLSFNDEVHDQIGERQRRQRIMELAVQTIKNRLINDIRSIGVAIHAGNRELLRRPDLPAGAVVEAGQIAIHFLGTVADQVEMQERPDGTFAIGLPLPEDQPKPKQRRSRKA